MFRLFVDSSTGIDVNPEWDYKEEGQKVESRHRTRSGEEYAYTWGEYDKIKFSVMHVNSSFKAIVNSWWSTNTDLLFMEEGGTTVTSVHLINKKKPIGAFVKPYNDSFKGVIELGTY